MYCHNGTKSYSNLDRVWPLTCKKFSLRAELKVLFPEVIVITKTYTPSREWDGGMRMQISLPVTLLRSLVWTDELWTRVSVCVQFKTWFFFLSVLSYDLYCSAHIVTSVLEIKGNHRLKILWAKKKKKRALITWSYFCISKNLPHHLKSYMFLKIMPPILETLFYSHQKWLIL